MSHPLTRFCAPTLLATAALAAVVSPLAQAQATQSAATAPTDERNVWDLTPLLAWNAPLLGRAIDVVEPR